ncbi:DUF1062 domain-containing protein [Chryseobacterium pennipullorum]|uniref:DUF1062 domain-containing protein n=1 Tax=Chryseobacterium pennipullorum TaxID=2258963 RepID=A0A3D9AVX4_9FLAO|nr:DUF1062 domain-containing protein [Chryseobacterium pennipullorum]REC45481.1 hypothetical protein DRF67_16240 [Chryseobacterium pennipullorum]
MSQEYIWEVKAKNTPLIKKKCNHCDSSRFYSSDKFRLNAQKKNIDIWLIYRCVKCKNTFNMTLFSRTRAESIPKDLFGRMLENDRETAWKYAFCHEIKRKNHVEADPDSVAYEIGYPLIEEIMNSDGDIISFTIQYPFDFGIRISSVIRMCLHLSASRFDRLMEADAIEYQGKLLHKKQKIKDGDTLMIKKDALAKLYDGI